MCFLGIIRCDGTMTIKTWPIFVGHGEINTRIRMRFPVIGPDCQIMRVMASYTIKIGFRFWKRFLSVTPFIELFINFFVAIDTLLPVKKYVEFKVDMTRIRMKITPSDIRMTVGTGGFGMG